VLGASGFLRNDGSYRGALEFRPGSLGGVNVINALDVDDYVRGVIPLEVSATWPAEALKAQAVAARTYALTTNKDGDGFDHYANTSSQVYASVVNGKLVLSGQVTGAANTIAVTSDSTLATDLGMTQSLVARDAQYTINGQSMTSASNTVSNGLAGVSLTLNGTTSSDASLVVTAPAPNTNTITTAIQGFVTAYNSTVDLIYGYVNDPKVANPTTDAQREAGMLQGDPQLLSILSNLRSAVTSTMSGAASGMGYLGNIGLSTGAAVGSGTISQDSLEGKLSLDTTKLQSMLASNFSGTKALFSNPTGSFSSEGLSQRMDDLINPQAGVSGTLAGRITSEASLIQSYSQQIADIEQRVTLHEATLRAQFTAMEAAVAQLQSSSSALSSSSPSSSG